MVSEPAWGQLDDGLWLGSRDADRRDGRTGGTPMMHRKKLLKMG